MIYEWFNKIRVRLFWKQPFRITVDGKNPDSHKAEAYTLISLLYFLVLLEEKMNISTKPTIYLDCMSIIDACKNMYISPENIDKKHKYLQILICDLANELPAILKFVKSHQDRKNRKLSFEESLNCYCDKQASQYYYNWSQEMKPKTHVSEMPTDYIYLDHCGRFFYENIESELKISNMKQKSKKRC